ncbi:MAG: class I SAM-dependent methyltransferase [Planctomycetota bacterium]
MPVKYYRLRDGTPEKGQTWRDENVEERLSLCAVQTIGTAILEHTDSAGPVLEAGCGLGRWVIYLKEKGCDIIGIDIARDALKLISGHDSSIKLAAADIESLPFPDETFGAVISLGVVEHLEHGAEKALSEFSRVLKKDGALLLAVPYQNITRTMMLRPIRWVAGKIITGMRGPRPFAEYRYLRREVVRMVERAGFSVEKIEADDFTPPYNMGMYVDWPFLRSKKKWKLNWFGRLVRLPWRALSKWSVASGVFVVAQKTGAVDMGE